MFGDFNPRRVSIVGAAKSGLAAAEFFKARGVKLFISDICGLEKLETLLVERHLDDVAYEAGVHTERILDADLIVLSPGVRSDHPLLVTARGSGIPVWSEMELGFRASKATFLAVTGSTGKSTTVSLLGEAVKASGRVTEVVGNIGVPVISRTPFLPAGAVVVAEVSSFQLETIEGFHPRAAAVLNLLKNHLDRYANEDEYYNAKKEIARNLTVDDILVLNANDPRLREWAARMRSRSRIVFFGDQIKGEECFWYHDGFVRYRFDGESGTIVDTGKMKIHGRHNYDNASAAAAMAKAIGIDNESIARGICSFSGLAHRLEFVADIAGVRYYNDSKSTTAESIACAVSAFGGKTVHLIAGGRDKGCDFALANESIRMHAKDITLIGEAAARIKSVWKGLAPLYHESTLEAAVLCATANSVAGDQVVFSPGCSSYDMFANFEERGDMFKRVVLSLAKDEVLS